MIRRARPFGFLARSAALIAALSVVAPQQTPAQTAKPLNQSATSNRAATLLADSILLTASDQLIAQGSVEIYHNGTRVTAQSIIYDDAQDKITLKGPIAIREPGQIGDVLLADQAEMNRDLTNGILLGARAVMARELQLSAARIERRDGGRITEFSGVIASSCTICATGESPLWEIRAGKITHDAQAQQLLFENAQFRALGVPLLWAPKMRLPDPTVTRMSGLLAPTLRSTSNLGAGIKLPYFLTLGPSADLLITPYVSTEQTGTLNLRYRRAFNSGDLEIAGAFSRDNIREGDDRGYLFADGTFDLPRDFTLDFDLRLVSDDAYLDNYGISSEDRLWSGVTLERVKPDQLVWLRAGNTHSLREDESNSTQPALAASAEWVQVYRPQTVGGELVLDWESYALRRPSTATTDGSDADDIPDGRDLISAAMTATWSRNWSLGSGVLARTTGQLTSDITDVYQDPAYPDQILRAQPQIAAEIRWPWMKTTGQAAQVIEPIAQVIWSPKYLEQVPGVRSQLVEFDEGNLFALSHYPSSDRRERGLRANLGVSWTRHDASGWSLGTTVGKIIREDDLNLFEPGTGLDGKRSDWLWSTNLRLQNGLTLSNRTLFDDAFSISREELFLHHSTNRYSMSIGYVWLDSNDAELRPYDASEITLGGSYDWNNGWSGSFGSRYDFTAERMADAAIGVSYQNECVTVDVSLSRSFTSSSSVSPDTDLGVSLQLAGFGGSSGSAARKVCTQ
ncbi:hypothetical protein BFP70_08480 [Thioclava sp. SK-1]|uniref:LPS-assembly protein LptD n=1 Tax=Thioclava sp. SK-1 TaxID=1889770 RepID=UPI000825E997|nr:LPS assembly protein LptD [Thioclava sp. SK-1]OCX66133.1 hypothetical protein BFP70_08480 [Thioclava sp. SK-1]